MYVYTRSLKNYAWKIYTLIELFFNFRFRCNIIFTFFDIRLYILVSRVIYIYVFTRYVLSTERSGVESFDGIRFTRDYVQ